MNLKEAEGHLRGEGCDWDQAEVHEIVCWRVTGGNVLAQLTDRLWEEALPQSYCFCFQRTVSFS